MITEAERKVFSRAILRFELGKRDPYFAFRGKVVYLMQRDPIYDGRGFSPAFMIRVADGEINSGGRPILTSRALGKTFPIDGGITVERILDAINDMLTQDIVNS